MTTDTTSGPIGAPRASTVLVGQTVPRCHDCGAPASHQVTGYPGGPRFVCEQGATVLRGITRPFVLRRLTLADFV